LRTEERIVLTFDICSSTAILEGLLITGNIKVWRDFLIWIEKHLVDSSVSESFDVYKFTGDGWIILFDYDYPGEKLIAFLNDLCEAFTLRLERRVLAILDAAPEITGLTFGMDRGMLTRITMNGQTEYIGRPINVACKLQSSIKDRDKSPQYKLMVTNHLHSYLRKALRDYTAYNVQRTLRTIAGEKPIRCKKIHLSMAE